MSGDRNCFQLNTTQVKDITILQRQSLDGARDGHIVQARFNRQRPEHGTALGKPQTHFLVRMLIQQGNVRRVDVDLAVLEIRADVVDMAVGIHQRNRQVGQLAHESL